VAAPPRNRHWQWAVWGGATAALAVLLLAVLMPRPVLMPRGGAAASAETLDVLTDDVDPEFYEDLDLYRWLAEDPPPSTGAPHA
ncbi:MAG: hypothetical protein QM661_01115, partial [Solimonas sp.]